MKHTLRPVLCLLLATLAFVGCKTSYRWTSSVPDKMRTVAVPTFNNRSDVTEMGNVAARQILREIQREGTFKIRRRDDAAVEIQGEIVSAGSGYSAGDRRTGSRLNEYNFSVQARISVIDRVNGRVLIDNRTYTGSTTYVIGQDILTGERNASGRAADDLARQVVDDLTAMPW